MKTRNNPNEISLIPQMIDRLIALIAIFVAIFTVRWEDVGVNWTNFLLTLTISLGFLSIIFWVFLKDRKHLPLQSDPISEQDTRYKKF